MNKQHPTIDQIVDYIHRELSPEDDAALLLHIESCAECRVQYQTEARLSEALRVHARATERDLPAGVINRIWDVVDAPPQPAWHERLTALLRPAVALPIAAACAVALYFGVASTHRGLPQATIDAAYYLDDHAALTSTVPFGEGTAVPSQFQNDQPSNDVVAVDSETITTADAVR